MPSPSPSSQESVALEQVRAELRNRGYLDHGFERVFLQDALRPQASTSALLRLLGRVTLMGAALTALVLSIGLAAVNGHLTAAPLDLLPLFLHLLIPASVVVAGGFASLALLVLALLRRHPGRHMVTVTFTAAVVAGVVVGAAAFYQLPLRGEERSPLVLLLVAVVLPLVLYGLVQLIEGALLGLAVRLTHRLPRRQLVSRRGLAWGAVVLALALLLPAFLAVGKDSSPQEAPSLPLGDSGNVLLVGIDGVNGEEVDYLLASQELPTLRGLLAAGGTLGSYPRRREAPAVFWTTVATALPAAEHGVRSLDAYRPLGMQKPLVESGWLRWYWLHVAEPLGLVEHRPVLSDLRRAPTLWELASRGGRPVLSVGWWGTYPAQALPGLVVAHGAYQTLPQEAPGAQGGSVASASETLQVDVQQLRGAVAAAPLTPAVAALPKGLRSDLEERAWRADLFYLRTFEEALALEPVVASLYLAAPDLVSSQLEEQPRALGALARSRLLLRQLRLLDDVLSGALPQFDGIAVIFDPGRRPEGDEGRILLWSRGRACEAVKEEVLDPESAVSGLFRLSGLPQSEELPPPPSLCPWPSPPATVETYGSREQSAGDEVQGEDYLENLRSLGYL
ncbi:MAG: hypothetical protein AAGD01_06955 [Acidobacteriota bacterium]